MLEIQRQPDESDKAWMAYRLYQDAGPSRTIRIAWKAYARATNLNSKHPSSGFIGWSKKYEWEARAASFDQAKRSATAIIAEERVDGNEPEIMAVAHLVATGQMDISTPQSKILLRMMDHILGKPGAPRVEVAPEPEPSVMDDDKIVKLLRAK